MPDHRISDYYAHVFGPRKDVQAVHDAAWAKLEQGYKDEKVNERENRSQQSITVTEQS